METKHKYLILKAWIDPWENDPGYTSGHKPVGYVETIEQAELIVQNGGFYTGKDCYTIMGKMDKFSYKKIDLIESIDL